MPPISLKFVLDSLLRPSDHPDTPSRAIRQILSGAVTTGVDLSAFQASLWAGWSIPAAAVISFCCTVVVSFVISRFYVFGAVGRQKRLAGTQFLIYVLAALVSLGLTQLVLLILAVHLGLLPILAKTMAVPVVFIWTLWVGKHLIFQHTEIEMTPPEKSPAESKWPKKIPDLTPEQQAIRDDFMRTHQEAMQTKWYRVIEQFNHRYPLRSAFPGARTLEIGAGLGNHLKWENYKQQEYHVNELRPNLCERLQAAFPGVEARAGDCQEGLPYEDEYFDRVLAIHVLEHLPNLPAALKEIRRVLKPEGLLSVVIPCEGGLAHTLGRNVTARPHFEKKYKQSYDWFVACEHISLPHEILAELKPLFQAVHQCYCPLLVPVVHMNLVIGLTLKKKPGA